MPIKTWGGTLKRNSLSIALTSLLAMAVRASGQEYTEIQSNAFNGVNDVSYDGSVFTWDAVDNSDPRESQVLSLYEDNSPVPGSTGNVHIHVESNFVNYNSTLHNPARAYLTGGLFSLTFDFWDGVTVDGDGDPIVTSHELSGPISVAYVEITFTSSTQSWLMGIFKFKSNLGVVNLPSSNNWPAPCESVAVALDFAVGADLERWRNNAEAWNDPMPSAMAITYDSQFSFVPEQMLLIGPPWLCDDGNACTENDTCSGGICAGTPVNCDDNNACTVDACDPRTGCTHTAVVCDDGDACTVDTCDPQNGCVHVPGARTVAGRYVFYNNSFYDSASSACATLTGANPCDDNTAIATDKAALRPGQMAGTANYISYSRGINGLMIDVGPGANCTPLAAGPLSASNFDFTVGNNADLGSYVAAAAPLSIGVTPGGGVAGSDRIKVVWADNAIPNRNWLRVVVKSNASGGQLDLSADDVFYFGLAIGDSETPGTTRVCVNQTDEIDARNRPHNSLARVPVATNSTYAVANAPDAKYDYDKSSTVSAIDEIISRNNPANSINGLLLLNPAP